LSETLLQRLTGALVSRPWFYELVQKAAGRSIVVERIKAVLPREPPALVFDIGSSSGGLSRQLGFDPISLDIDPVSLLAMRRQYPSSVGVVGDAAELPFPADCFDLSLCTSISHHLPEPAWRRMLSELGRVTRGTLIFIDPVRDDTRAVSRLLWRYDRGRFPRRRDDILAALRREFVLGKVVEFSVYHRYLLCAATPDRRPDRLSEAGSSLPRTTPSEPLR